MVLVSISAAAQWQRVADLPEVRYSGALVNVGEKLYYIGGSRQGSVKMRTVFVYDVAADSWTRTDSLATARHRFGAAECRGKIYVFGGWGDGGRVLRSCEMYDTATRRWTAIESLPSGRASVFSGATQTPARVFCIGGWTGSIPALDDNLQYDPGTGRWTERAPMPTARCEGASASVSGYVFCIGGTPDGSALMGKNQAYDPAQDTWLVPDSMPERRMACAAAAWGDIVVLGGIVRQLNTSSLAQLYNARHNYWRACESLPEPLRYLAAASAPRQSERALFVAGGIDIGGDPSNRVYRTQFPLGISEAGAAAAPARPVSTIARAGALLAVPRGATGREFFAADGSLVEYSAGDAMAAVPRVAPGVYLARWRGPGTVTRLVVVDR